jgi:hypothetical protein
MRWMTQKWIAPRDDETIWDVVLDVMMALFGAAILTQLIRLLLSTF